MHDQEILNIDYHVKNLVLKALNKYPTVEQSAAALGVSLRTLLRYKQTYGIGKNKEGIHYLRPQKNIVLVGLLN